jgi:hypothetical protein
VTRKTAARRENRPRKNIFVIMPFSATPTRSASDLAEFFATNLKSRIENADALSHRYAVSRSDDAFNITEQIIRDLYDADIVLCDLSGPDANPNVMYELGVRLAITNKPVILFREAADANRRIFDIQGFHTFEYQATRYRELEDYILAKLKKFESGVESYESPILRVVQNVPSVVAQVKLDRAVALLDLMWTSMQACATGIDVVIDEFLQISHEISLGDEPVIQRYLTTPETFAEVDWSGLSLRPRLPPAVHTFLSEPMLLNLLPAKQVARISKPIADYYGEYLAAESIWHHLARERLTEFLIATESIYLGLRTLAVSLSSSDEERVRQLAQAMKWFDSPRETLERYFAIEVPAAE